MTATARATQLASLVLLAAILAAACALARAQGAPVPGGSVSSVLGLSLGEPGGFSPARRGGANVYTTTIRAGVTATDMPVQLSVADGEVIAGPRQGHLVRGASILPAPLLAAAGGGAYRSFDTRVPPPLKRWNQPVVNAEATIRLRQVAPDARALRGHRKLLLVTLTAGGP